MYIYIRVVTRIIDSINSNFHERKIQIQGGELCRKYAKYTLLQDRLNYKSTKAKRGKKARRKIFGIFHVVFSTIKGEKRGGEGGKKEATRERRILNDVYENGGVEERPWFCKRSTSWPVSPRVTRAARFPACPPSFFRLTTICWRACQRFFPRPLFQKRMKIALDRRDSKLEFSIFHRNSYSRLVDR